MNLDDSGGHAGVAVDHSRAVLAPQLAALLGDAHVLTDATSRRFHAQDVHGCGVLPLAVVRPGSVEELAAAVQLVTAAGAAIVARGGGMSYTDGYLPIRENTVTVDTTRLNRIVEINPRDRYVTVECGVTWKDLAEALAPHALRTPYWGPLSGLRATVGGALSQGSIFLGSGLHGPVQESLLALEVVLADGSLLKTGGAALAHGVPFFRHFGPDLSSLFTGDCGAFGIKVRATLRLIPAPPETRYLSFSLAEAEAVFGLMADVAREGLASECMAFDPGLQAVRMKRVSLAEDAKALGQVVRSAGGVLAGLKEGAKVVLAGRNFLEAGGFSVHLGVDGRDAADAESRCARIRALADGRAREVENTIPKVMRANPFMELNSMLGPGGERWVPVHCVVPLSRGAAMFAACEAVFARHATELERLGIDHGCLSCTVGGNGVLVEPCIYWPDARQSFHETVLDPTYLAQLPVFAENLPARQLVAQLRGELADLFAASGAASFQIGKLYRYRASLDAGTLAMLDALKRQLDPRGLMNPGVLGFAAPTV
jgi:FAD/FMN-containing dehydrogenase